MKVIKDKIKEQGAEQTYSLCGLTDKDLKCIRAGLELFWTQTNNSRVRLMIAEINSGALKDHVDKYNDDVNPEEVKKHNKAVMKALGKLVPTEQNAVPIPAALKLLKYK
jgi:hypothetical protein